MDEYIKLDKDKVTRIPGVCFDGRHEFKNRIFRDVYEVLDVNALNQLVGYAKYNNRGCGPVFCRGECKLHNTLLPSIFRERNLIPGLLHELVSIIQSILKKCRDNNDDNEFVDIFKIDSRFEQSDDIASRYVEAVLQHYGMQTRFLDVVDNHWIALWMGLNRFSRIKNNGSARYIQRRFSLETAESEQELFQYILLMSSPKKQRLDNELDDNSNLPTEFELEQIDLRQCLPSKFLRPHAQHGHVISVKESWSDAKKYFLSDDEINQKDLSKYVICILKVRIDRALQWIGSGTLLTQENLFPSPAYDAGYKVLLKNNEAIFKGKIIKYC